MTVKLYETDSYLHKFTGTVTGCIEREGEYYVELDQTAFFPNQGGQSCDKGTLNEVSVNRVEIDKDTVFHVLDTPLGEGTTVEGVIDFDYRFRNMQMHSGEHIFSGTVNRLFGFSNVGFHLSDNSATMDFDGKMTAEQIALVENRVNHLIVENRRITAFVPDREQLSDIEYRSKKELDGDVRLVEIEGVDICACCAPHVNLTGEIGLFKVVNVQNYKAGVRIDYLCGFRALEYFNVCTDSLNAVSKLLSVKPGCEADGVKALFEENRKLNLELSEARKGKVYTLSENASEINSFYVLVLPKELDGFIKYGVEVMHSRYGTEVAVFSGNDETGYKYLIESSKRDLTEVTECFRNNFGAKGGGRKDSIQGSLTAGIDKTLECL